MIRCGRCNVKYIGQTGLALNLRINNHRKLCNSNIIDKNNNEYVQSKFEYDHFNIHPFSNALIEILDVVPDHNKRLELENKYIIEFKTAYPYGLNDRVNGVSVNSVKDSTCIYSTFFSNYAPSVRNHRIRSLKKINKYVDFDILLEEINDHCFVKSNVINFVRGKIFGLKRNKAKLLVKKVLSFKFTYEHVKDLIIDLLKFKINCLNFQLDSNKFDTYLVIDFSHKYIDLLNISQLLYSPDLVKVFPIKETYPKISYKYSRTLGSLVFNYTEFSKNIRVDNIEEYPCTCENNRFKDAVLNHVVTGDLDILEDLEMKLIFQKGSKFRLIPTFSKDKIKIDIKKSIDDYIYHLAYKLNIQVGFFSEWKTLLLDKINIKISVTNNVFPSTINFVSFRNKISDFHNNYVIVPVDKAGCNFGFICKKFYAQVLSTEIDTNSTFELSNVDLTGIMNKFFNVLKEYKVLPSKVNVPFMYAIPKFHKNPIKFRFITSSFNCVNKDVNIILNLILDKLNKKVTIESEFNWIINNNKKVLQSIDCCNENPVFPGNFMAATFDFSTLYTTLPHDDLIRCIVALYNKYFDNDVSIYYKKNLVVTKINFVEILKFCIRNNYIKFNNNIYRQKVGIPMGANYSPNIANLYLHFYESKFLSINHADGRLRYRFTFRYIDDLLSLNNRDILFDINAIYPSALQVSNTNMESHRKCSFLDVDIQIINGKFVCKIYDKRRDFNFDILGLPSFMSNIPVKMAYGVLCSQFIRFASVCHLKEDFILNCQIFINKTLNNGFPSFLLKKYIHKFECNKKRSLLKFNFTNRLNSYLQFHTAII